MIINIEKCYKLLLHFIHGFTLNKGNIYVNIVLPHYLKKKKICSFIKHMKILSRKYVLVLPYLKPEVAFSMYYSTGKEGIFFQIHSFP